MGMNFGSFASRVVATKVVATDGTGDFTDIQKAIDDLPSGGGVVYIKEGTYTITSSITFPTANISIRGAGFSTIIESTSAITFFDIESGDYYTTIENIRLLGDRSAGQIGVLIKATNCFVRGCTFSMLNIGTKVTSGDFSFVVNNFFEGCGVGILVSPSIQTNITFLIQGNMISASQTSSIKLENVNRCTVNDNVIRNSSSLGIQLASSADSNLISGNNIDACSESGIILDATADQNLICNNVSTRSGAYGIRIANGNCDNNLIDGNVVVDNAAGQISDLGTGTTIGDNVTA